MSRMLGTWRYYGVYNERDVHVISPNLPLPDASMVSIAPCMAYRMMKDFLDIQPGQTIIQNAANNICGHYVIQLCKAWGIHTINVVMNNTCIDKVKEYLFRLGASAVYTLDEAEKLANFDAALTKPVLALNCIGGRHENAMLNLLQPNGKIINYGCTFDAPLANIYLRPDVTYHRFNLNAWYKDATCVQKDLMYSEIIQLMVAGTIKSPVYEAIELKDFVYALRNTLQCEAFSTPIYVFDLTLP